MLFDVKCDTKVQYKTALKAGEDRKHAGGTQEAHRKHTESAQKAHRKRTESAQKAHRKHTESTQETQEATNFSISSLGVLLLMYRYYLTNSGVRIFIQIINKVDIPGLARNGSFKFCICLDHPSQIYLTKFND